LTHMTPAAPSAYIGPVERARILYGMRMAEPGSELWLAVAVGAGAAAKAGFDLIRRRGDRQVESTQWFVDQLRQELGKVYTRLDAMAKQIVMLQESNNALVMEKRDIEERLEQAQDERERLECQIRALRGEMGEVKTAATEAKALATSQGISVHQLQVEEGERRGREERTR
jgi:regulator of replication initiation timing